MADLTLSIIVPTHNRPDLLPRAVDSALSQDFADLEVLVVDDGSDPPARLPAHPKLRTLRHEQSRGGAAARNTGTRAAAGRFVCYLDDDELHSEMVRVSLEAQERADLPPPVGVLTGIDVVDPRGRVLETRLPVTLPRGRHFSLEAAQPGRSFHTKQSWWWSERSSWERRLGRGLPLACPHGAVPATEPVVFAARVPVVSYRLLAHPAARVSRDPAKRQESFAPASQARGGLRRTSGAHRRRARQPRGAVLVRRAAP